MSARAQSREQREVAATARRYRRDGYKVIRPEVASDRPGFLGDLVPDLIAERDDDKVVIEVKQAAAVVGANDIVELAERVAGEPGWRFELIGLPNPSSIRAPDLTRGADDIERLLDQGFLDSAFVMACAMIEYLAAYASVSRRRKPEAQSLRALVRDLVVFGIIDEAEKREIDAALAKRNSIFTGSDGTAPTRGDVETLLKIAVAIRGETLAIAEE